MLEKLKEIGKKIADKVFLAIDWIDKNVIPAINKIIDALHIVKNVIEGASKGLWRGGKDGYQAYLLEIGKVTGELEWHTDIFPYVYLEDVPDEPLE